MLWLISARRYSVVFSVGRLARDGCTRSGSTGHLGGASLINGVLTRETLVTGDGARQVIGRVPDHLSPSQAAPVRVATTGREPRTGTRSGHARSNHSNPARRLHAALQGGGIIPSDLIEPLRNLLGQLDHATGAVDRAAEHYPDAVDVAKRSAYREASLDVVLGAFARLRGIALLAGG